MPRYSPFFVTWETSRESILRGCIGTLSPRRLRGGLAEYALLAGTRDSRFPPVTGVAELERLAVKISLLHSYETLPTARGGRLTLTTTTTVRRGKRACTIGTSTRTG